VDSSKVKSRYGGRRTWPDLYKFAGRHNAMQFELCGGSSTTQRVSSQKGALSRSRRGGGGKKVATTEPRNQCLHAMDQKQKGKIFEYGQERRVDTEKRTRERKGNRGLRDNPAC